MFSMPNAFSLVWTLLCSCIQASAEKYQLLGDLPFLAQRQNEVHTIHLYQDQCTRTCISGWTGYNFTCLQFINEEKNWIEAEVYCQVLIPGGHLASIHSKENNDFVLELVQNEGSPHPKIWIGSSDMYEDGTECWTDGSRWDYHYWLTGRPIAGSWCNTMNLDSGFWSDEECTISKFPFVCISHLDHN
ncbi:lectin-like [Hypanus sabinus]|uniref:lectin-like n=1 Tax=Hypanus sabinus TaxID=79690 RepID=UPI0028C3F3E0|nr:lectin-like [Hypanus sabinus]